ncbi:SirB1 family protein [Spirulina subsalsa FACHB-351]|uniref:SirB1 family protein n=2 Tax=Spirulina subsalsa TaxID=54311 RepID=A0ABT3L8K2_9CYAN|nr:SirB1 family protein [Spirulina subsalsa FACHB-351]
MFSLARQNFYNEIKKNEAEIDLAKAALYIAQEEYDFLEPDVYLGVLDTIAAELKERLPDRQYPLKVIKIINQYLYEDLGFRGNKGDYYDPRNSFLNDVLDRRLGIPISLSLVYLEVAKRLDFPMVGIGMPGHFIIRPEFENVGIFIDAFDQGSILFEQDCQDILAKLYQQSVVLQPEFLQPISKHQFLSRILTNLKFIFLNRQQFSKAIATIDRILLLSPESYGEVRDRGLLYYQLNEWALAVQDLEEYLRNVPNAPDALMIQEFLNQMR